MDNYLDKNRLNSLYYSNAIKEAKNLKDLSDRAVTKHLKNFHIRHKFTHEIEIFIKSQLNGITKSKNEEQCRECLLNLKTESRYIEDQMFNLMGGNAKIVASATLEKKLDAWGYIINGVGVVISGTQVVAGFLLLTGSIAHGNIVGMTAGGLLMLHGVNGIEEGIMNLAKDRNDQIGDIKKGYLLTARFLGFDNRVGNLAYSAMDLSLSGYGLLRVIMKPDAWRLFKYLPSDYVRNFKSMGAPALTLEGIGDTLSIKSGYDELEN